MGNLHPKVSAPAIAAMLVGIVLWAIQAKWNVTVPSDVSTDMVGLVGLVIGYLIPSPPAAP